MKFYRYAMVILFLSLPFSLHAFLGTWVDNISAKINNTTELIMHREFPKAQRIEIHNEQGAIVINSWKQDTIAVEMITSCSISSLKDIKVDMEHINKSVKIHTIFTDHKIKGSVSFNILLPRDTDIIITTQQGDIVIKDMNGSLQIQSVSGDIKLLNPRHNVQAKTINGSIIIRTDQIEKNKEFNLETEKGNIELYATQTINTCVYARALNGKVTSDLFITLDSKITKLDATAWREFRQVVHGSLGEPTSKLNMTADNGSIIILPYTKQNDIF